MAQLNGAVSRGALQAASHAAFCPPPPEQESRIITRGKGFASCHQVIRRKPWPQRTTPSRPSSTLLRRISELRLRISASARRKYPGVPRGTRASAGDGGAGGPPPEGGGKEKGGQPRAESPEDAPTNTPPPAPSGSSSSGDSSSDAPSPEAPARILPLPRNIVETLRDQVFGFDTFFVTGQEAYEGGVLFRGNLRGDATAVYNKLQQKLTAKFGEAYALYLLVSPEDDRPVAVVVPKESITPPPPAVPDWVGATAFGLVSLLTILLTNSPSPEFGFLPSTDYLAGPLLEGIPASLLFTVGLLAHEAGHLLAAKALGLDLALPFFIPSWQLGSFGAITRIKSVVPSRSALVRVAAAGPLSGALFSLAALLFSLLLLRPPPGAEGFYITLDSSAFQDSFLVGGLAKLILGGALVQGSEVVVSPLTVAAWSCLLVNAINAIPAGELDGARIAQGLFGRQGAQRLSQASLVLLGVTGIFNDVALFWVVLIFFLQRGPVPPQANEVADPDAQAKVLGAATLLLCFLAYCPLPFEL